MSLRLGIRRGLPFAVVAALAVIVLCGLLLARGARGQPVATNAYGYPAAGYLIGSASPPGFTVYAFTCPSNTFCLGVNYRGRVLTGDPLAGSTGWSLRGFVLRGGDAVSCPSRRFCAIEGLGRVATTTDPTAGAAAWRSSRAFFPSGPNATASISCPSRRLCALIGGAANTVYVSSKPGSGRAWKAVRLRGRHHLESISCPSTHLCAISDLRGAIITSTNPLGGAKSWRTSRLPRRDAYKSCCNFKQIVCPTARFCALVDLDPGHGSIVTIANPAGSRRRWRVARPRIVESLSGGITCSSSSLCVAGEVATGNIVTSNDPAGGTKTWSEVSVAFANTENPTSLLQDCPSNNECVIISQSAAGGEAYVSSHPRVY